MAEDISMNKITAEVITDLAKSTASTVIKKITKSYKNMVAKDDIDYGYAYEVYLTTAQNSINKAKTILYGQTPHDLYSFYESMGIKNQEKEIDTSNVNNILEIGHKLIITGTGGIGKSMLMRHCFLDAIKNTKYIPVLVELRGLNEKLVENISIEKYIYNILCIYGFKLEEEYFNYSLNAGCYLILFDGYDEVRNNISQKVSNEIIDFSNKYSENYCIVSSRPLTEFVGWSDFVEYTSMPLNKKQALRLIKKLEYDEELKNKFAKELDEELFEKYYSFASNPLLLTIMLMTFEGRLSIPDNKIDFYDQAFATLFHKHDATKKGKYKREIVSKLGYEDFKKVFSYFCFRTFFKNEYEFSEKSVLENIEKSRKKVYSYGKFEDIEYLDDLTNSVCMLVREGLNYRFSHRSFQEYFSAVYTTQLGDNEQKQFISAWLKSMDGRLTTDYLDILCALQPERFMKNVLYDAMKELYNMYIANGENDEWFLKFMYSGISLHKGNDDNFKIYVRVENSFYHTIFCCMLHYIRYEYNDIKVDENYYELIRRIQKEFKNSEISDISFEKLREKDLFNNVLNNVSFVFKRKDAVFQALNDVDKKMFGNKRKFESMLDDL